MSSQESEGNPANNIEGTTSGGDTCNVIGQDLGDLYNGRATEDLGQNAVEGEKTMGQEHTVGNTCMVLILDVVLNRVSQGANSTTTAMDAATKKSAKNKRKKKNAKRNKAAAAA